MGGGAGGGGDDEFLASASGGGGFADLGAVGTSLSSLGGAPGGFGGGTVSASSFGPFSPGLGASGGTGAGGSGPAGTPGGKSAAPGKPAGPAAPTAPAAQPSAPSKGAQADYSDWYPLAGDLPSWYLPGVSSLPPRSPNALGPPVLSRPDSGRDFAIPPTPHFGPGGSSMQDLQAWARAHPDLASKQPPVSMPGGYPLSPLISAQGHATVGPIGTDTVPSWLSPGEFVEQNSAVSKYGPGFMQALNEGRIDPSSIHYYGVGGFAGVDDPATETAGAVTPVTPKPPVPAPAPTTATPGAESQGQPKDTASQSGTKSEQFNQGQSSPGLGISGGAGAQAAGMFPGGSLAFALAGRTVGFGGQLAAIGTEGLMQTLLPDDSPLANFSNTLPGKVLGAVAGARPAGKNTAGQQTPPQLTPEQAANQKSSGGGQSGGINIGEMHNYGVNNGEDVASALGRQTYASYNAGQNR